MPIVELVSRYAHIFGSKSCCFSDLRRFVTALSVEERAEVLAALPSMDDVSKMSEDDKVRRLPQVATNGSVCEQTEKTAVKAATFEALRRSLAPSSKEGSSTVAHVLALYDTFLPLGERSARRVSAPSEDTFRCGLAVDGPASRRRLWHPGRAGPDLRICRRL